MPRHKAAETVKERERADLLPVKVNGELVYRRDAKTDDQALPPVSSSHLQYSLCSVWNIPHGMLSYRDCIPSTCHVNGLPHAGMQMFPGIAHCTVLHCIVSWTHAGKCIIALSLTCAS